MKNTNLIILIIAAILVVAFILSFIDIAFFNFQCYRNKNACNECNAWSIVDPINVKKCPTGKIYEAYESCNKNCKKKNFQCTYKDNTQEKCIQCVKNCEDDMKKYQTSIHAFGICAIKCRQI
jgi:hypothetical protein